MTDQSKQGYIYTGLLIPLRDIYSLKCHVRENNCGARKLKKKKKERETVVLFSPGWPRTHYVTQEDLECVFLLPVPLQCWNYRHEPPHWFYLVLGWNPELHTCWAKSSINSSTTPVSRLEM